MTISARGSQQKGETIVKLAALRSVQSKLTIAFFASAALLLGSCGGGGAASQAESVGIVEILPATGTIYAGVPTTINVIGGRKPYLVVSDQFTVLPINFTLTSNSFTIIANNPGVTDIGQGPGQVPSRTVNVTVRDGAGSTAAAKYDVAQNFFTGYGESYTSTCPGTGTVAAQACSGQDSVVRLDPISQGTLYGNRVLQLDKIRGDFHFVQEPPGATPQIVDTIQVTTDHEGIAFARIRVNVNAPTQIASYRLTDVATKTSIEILLVITQEAPIDQITLVPSSVTFSSGPASQCGSGQAQVFVFDGAPPYTVTTTPPVLAAPQVVQNSGDSFVVAMPSGLTAAQCPQNPAVFVTDSRGQRAQLTVTTGAGSTPAVAINVVPGSFGPLTCALNSESGAIVGGVGPLSAVSNHPRVSAIISGNIITVSRAPNGDLTPPAPYPATAIIAITDGATIFSLPVTGIAPTCP
jgi:hypothetical protein